MNADNTDQTFVLLRVFRVNLWLSPLLLNSWWTRAFFRALAVKSFAVSYCPSRNRLDRHSRSIKLGQTESAKSFVVAGTLLFKNPHRNLLAEFH